jgi:hypothetical protein
LYPFSEAPVFSGVVSFDVFASNFPFVLPQGTRNVVKNYSAQMTLTFTQSGRMFAMNNQSPTLLALRQW